MKNTGESSRDSPLVIIAANTAWSVANFRSELITQLQKAGYATLALAPEDEYVERVPCRFIPIHINRMGTNPIEDLRLLRELKGIYRELRPFAVLHFTAKLNIYGTLAARRLEIRCISNISGLGSGFISGGPISWIQEALYRIANRYAEVVFFQNPDDARYFRERRLLRPEQVDLLPGSGVDLTCFAPQPKPAGGPFVFLLIARLIKDKGIYEYVDAARTLKAKYSGTEFRLMGFLDNSNPTAITKEEVRRWSNDGTITYVGRCEDVRDMIAQSDCVVLPSYREGTPRTLLEAASMAKPLVTTDVPGCRQVVDHGSSGYLCRAKDAADLADKMERVLQLEKTERERMGLRGRVKMEQEFDQAIVIGKYLEVLGRYRA